jgi:Ni/Fe-hydrogenase subunit HybB-like protein
MIFRMNKTYGSYSCHTEHSKAFTVWISILLAFIVMAAYALLLSLIYDMEIFEFSLRIPWATMVSNYVFLVGSSVGLCMVSSLGLVFGLDRYDSIVKRGLFMALIAIIFGMISIMLHLGHPERPAIFTMLTPNPRSAMWGMGIVYPPYILSLVLSCWLLFRQDLLETAAASSGFKAKIYGLMALEGLRPYLNKKANLDRLESRIYGLLPLQRWGLSLDDENADIKWARIFGAMAFISGLLAYTVESTLFAHTEARGFWYGALTPVDFYLGACMCGFAWILVAKIATHKVKRGNIPIHSKRLMFEMGNILALLLSIEILFIAYKMGHGLFNPLKGKTIMLLLKGPYSPAFWGIEIFIGLVLPIVMLLYSVKKERTTGLMIASVMVLIGYFVKRYDFVTAAQVYPAIKHGLPSYLPTLMETLLIAGIIAGVFLVYTLGELFLPLNEKRQ